MSRRLFTMLMATAILSGCGGVPLRSIPRLMQMSGALLEAQPAEFRVAIQVDARIAPPPASVPLLVIQVAPKVAGAFEPVNKKLPLRWDTASGASLGLEPASAGRRWLLYSLPPETQTEMVRVQKMIRLTQAQPGYQKGGQLSLGIEQTDLAITQPQLANTRWDTWLQVKQSDGFFEIWSGTPAQILAAANPKP